MVDRTRGYVRTDTQFIEGTPVLDASGERIGSVSEGAPKGADGAYLIVRQGRIFGKELPIPRAAIAGYDGDGIHLKLTKEEIKERQQLMPARANELEQASADQWIATEQNALAGTAAMLPGAGLSYHPFTPEGTMLPPVPPASASMVNHMPAEEGNSSMSFTDPNRPLDGDSSEGMYTPAPVQTQTYPATDVSSGTTAEENAQQDAQTSMSFDLSHPWETMRAAVDQIQQRAGDAADQLKTQAGAAVEQLKNQAGDTVEKIKTQANDQLDNQMTQAGLSLATVADAVDTLSDQLRRGNQKLLATYADRAAGHVDELATYLRQSDPNKVLHDIEDFARREPALFLAGAFAIGLLGTRFLKSSSSHAEQ